MPSKIVERIAAQTGIPRLIPVLCEDLPLSDLQSLLMHVYQARTALLREADLLARSERNSMLAPSSVDARLLHEFDRTAFEVAEGFEAIELSPVGPVGLSRVLGAIDQNSVLTAIRNVEVLGDSTTAMALECARRRKDPARRADSAPVRLCSSHRVLRLQPFDVPGFTPHFRLFSVVSAGRDTGASAFEIRHLREHVHFYLQLFRVLNARGFSLTTPLVEISDTTIVEALIESLGVSRGEIRQFIRAHDLGGSGRFLAERGITLPKEVLDPASELPDLIARRELERYVRRLALVKTLVVDPMRSSFPEAEFRFNFARLEGLGYYTGLTLRISPSAPDGRRYPIVDGGFTDWTARLLQNQKERLLTTGIGSEFTCVRYRP